MAISLVNTLDFTSGTTGTGGTTTLSLSGLTISSGDVLVLCWNDLRTNNRGLSASGDNSGAFSEQADTFANDTNDANLGVYVQKQGATPDTTITVEAVVSGIRYVARVLQFSGVDATTQIDVATPTPATGTNLGRPNPPSITPTTSGAKIVAVYAGTKNSNVYGAWTAPGNVSSFSEIQNSSAFPTPVLGTGFADWTSGAFDPAAVTDGSNNVNDSWAAATIALRPSAGGATTHAATGALTGQIGSVAGTAAHIAVHGSSGALTGQLGSVTGSAGHIAIHASSGTLTGQGSTVAGSAARFRAFTSSGVLAGGGSVVDGAAARADGPIAHDAAGSLTGQLGSVAGSSARFRAFAASGTLIGAGSLIDGSAARVDGPVTHDATGTLSGQLGSLSASAARFRAFTSSGVLAGQIGSVSGAGVHNIPHDAAGDLAGQGSDIDGAADRQGAIHAATGALVGSGSTLSGSAARVRVFIADGALAGVGASIAGSSARLRQFAATGELVGAGALVTARAFGSDWPDVTPAGWRPANDLTPNWGSNAQGGGANWQQANVTNRLSGSSSSGGGASWTKATKNRTNW